MKKKKIALLFGGTSSEREISIKTGKQIQGALNKNKWIVTTYDLKTDMKKFLNDALNKKFDLDAPIEEPILIRDDFIHVFKYLILMRKGEKGSDDIDPLVAGCDPHIPVHHC